MNVSVSKILLGVSITAYTYLSWDHMMSGKKEEAPPAKATGLTAAMVNRQFVLSLGRDVFESVAVERSEETAAENALAAATGQSASDKLAMPLSLQGIFMTPAGHAALVNGVPVNEGEEAELIGGGKIFARKIGDTFAVIERNGRTSVLKLEDPALNAPGTSGSATASPAPAAAAPPPPRPAAPSSPATPRSNGHGGGSDPYAGHRTGRR